MKSNVCFSKKNNEPLTVYSSEYQAQEGADYINNTYNKNLSPYKCSNCDNFHLSPVDRQTPSSKCRNCTSSTGSYKDLYRTKEGAQRRASILYKERNLSLNIYPCRYNSGWHLTKQSV